MEETLNIKEFIDDQLMEVAGLTSRREYNMALVRARQSAEQLIKAYAKENNIEFETLADTIEQLYAGGAISRTSRDAFHNIRILGNKAVHEGDNDAENAKNAYYFLKDEIQTYMSRNAVSIDRTPVRVERNEVSNQRPAFTEDGNRIPAIEAMPRKQIRNNDIDLVGFSAQRRNQAKPEGRNDRRSSGRNQRRPSGNNDGGFNIFALLRILIPVVVIILLIVIIKNLIPSKPAEVETTPIETVMETEPPTEEETEPPTTEPPTTEAPKIEYQIKGEGVNIRYFENQERVYTQLNTGAKIGTVQEIEGSDFVKFILDDIAVVVRKDFITPVSNQ